MESSTQVRKRTCTKEERFAGSERSSFKPRHDASKSRSAASRFLKLNLLQVALGSIFFITLEACLRHAGLKDFREKASLFVELQYVTKWGKSHAGPRDICFAISAFTAIISVRAALQLVMFWVLGIARKDLGVGVRIRFTEQAWCVFYYSAAAFTGLRLLRTQEYGWNAGSLWVDFPHYFIDPAIKKYYLTVLGYWFTQVFIIHIEVRRKDHYQMLTHHFVTCALVVGSYCWSYTRIGHLVMILMDSVDIFLSLAKCSKYLKYPKWVTDGLFVVFLISWVLLRHFVYMYEMVYGAFPALDDLLGRCVFDPEASLYSPPIQCFSAKTHYTFFILAMALQAITVFWLVMILNIVVRVVQGDGADDTRSDTEED